MKLAPSPPERRSRHRERCSPSICDHAGRHRKRRASPGRAGADRKSNRLPRPRRSNAHPRALQPQRHSTENPMRPTSSSSGGLPPAGAGCGLTRQAWCRSDPTGVLCCLERKRVSVGCSTVHGPAEGLRRLCWKKHVRYFTPGFITSLKGLLNPHGGPSGACSRSCAWLRTVAGSLSATQSGDLSSRISLDHRQASSPTSSLPLGGPIFT